MNDRSYVGGVQAAGVWLTWPSATLTASPTEINLRSTLGSVSYKRSDVARVFMKKGLFRWTLRFYNASGREVSTLRFMPRASDPVVRDLTEMGWPVDEEQPSMKGVS